MLDNHLHRFCGGRYQRAVETVTIRLSGMSAEVEREFYRCSKCDDEQRTVEQREAAERTAVERIRAAHALLAPKEIRQLRESIGLTPAQLGELLYGTPRGVVEGWERGRYLQNRETDALLRSLRDRETLERRAAKAGVTLPDPDLLAAARSGATPNAKPAADVPTAPSP
jgi:putative zinc finger/helix-turn-helix YgiT family protein